MLRTTVCERRKRWRWRSWRYAGVEARLAGLENDLAQVLEELRRGTQPAARPEAAAVAPQVKAAPLPARTSVPRAPARSPGVVGAPSGLDPHIVQQALGAGVSQEALQEIGGIIRPLTTPALPGRGGQHVAGFSTDEDEEDEHLGDGSGLADPLSRAVVHLSGIVAEMRKEKKVRKDKGLEAILDRADSGWTRDSTSSSRSKSAALRALQKTLQTDPKLIYQALEANLQEDWESGGQRLPGAQISRISARGWLEHRSRIGGFASSVRPAWLFGGIWDALMCNRVDEARARAALAVACYDQMACDRGGWLMPSEWTLEPPPPMASFNSHHAPDQWEAQTTRLVDERWMELIMAKLKDLSDYQDKKAKLSGPKPRAEEQQKTENKKDKGKGKGKKGKEQSAETTASSSA